jgi:disulfide bond formation protein DsbB
MGYALYAEHILGLEPCPMCIFQRLSTILLGLIFLIGSFPIANRSSRLIIGLLISLTSLSGILVASRHVWLQNLPPEKVPGCGPGLDFMVENFPLSDVFEMVFSGSGECANVDWSLLGLSMPAWVIISLSILTIFGLWSNLRPYNKAIQ